MLFNPLDAVMDCRKILSDYSSLIHCHENFLILYNDGSCYDKNQQMKLFVLINKWQDVQMIFD